MKHFTRIIYKQVNGNFGQIIQIKKVILNNSTFVLKFGYKIKNWIDSGQPICCDYK